MAKSQNIKFKPIRQKALSFFPLFALGLAWGLSVQASELIVIYLTDLHSQIRPDSQDKSGGYAKIAAYIKQQKASAKSDQDVLVVAGGDLVNKGALPCRRTNDVACVELFSKMGIDLAVFGSQELSRSAKDLNELISHSGIEWISSNVKSTSVAAAWKDGLVWKAPKSGEEFYLNSWTLTPGPKEWDPKKAQLKVESNFNSVALKNWLEAAAKRPVILFPHQTLEMDKNLLKMACEKLSPSQVLALFKGNEDAELKDESFCAPILEPKSYGKSLVRSVFKKQSNGTWKMEKSEFVAMDEKQSEDPDIKKTIDALYSKYGQDADEKILSVQEDMGATAVAHWLAETYRKVSKADLAIVNSGVTKQNLGKGDVSVEQLYISIPYNNSLRGFDVSKKQLEKGICDASRRKRDDILDKGSDLVFSSGTLVDAGLPTCHLEGMKTQMKVVMDDFLMKNSKRWLGQDYSSISFSFGMNTEQVLSLALKKGKK